MIEIEFNNRQTSVEVDSQRLIAAARQVLEDLGRPHCQLSIAVVDDESIHELNQTYLQHDYATDVLSFPLEHDEQRLEGEVVVSAEMAAAQSRQYGWSAADELLLYVIHGVLHLVGLDDQTEEARADMRAAERKYLGRFGLQPHR